MQADPPVATFSQPVREERRLEAARAGGEGKGDPPREEKKGKRTEVGKDNDLSSSYLMKPPRSRTIPP